MAKSAAATGTKWLVILAVLGGGGYYGWHWWQKKDDKAKPQFTTAKIERGDIVQMVTASGTLNPVVNVQVGSQISGMILKLYADFNSMVKAGDLVAEIDPATYKARVEQNAADLANAKAALELAQVNARRAEALYKEKLISQSEYDSTMASLHQAEATVLTHEAQLNSTKVDLARCSIFAPIDGIVIDRKVDVGQTVAASLNAPVLFQIANDLTKMQIDANVAEADVGGVEVGQDVKFTVDAFPGRDFIGKVVQVRNAPVMVQNVVSYDTVIEVNNASGKLKPGMTANVQIVTAKRENSIRIPNSALRFRPPPGSETKKPAGDTNVVGKTSVADAADAEAIPQTPEEMIKKVKQLRARGEQMSDEMRAKFREMVDAKQIDPAQVFGGGAGGPGGGGKGGRSSAGGGPRRSTGDRPSSRTVYTVESSISSTNLVTADMLPVVIKTGITDGVYTEILDGLKEGDTIVSGQVMAQKAAAATNPFGGGFSRGPR